MAKTYGAPIQGGPDDIQVIEDASAFLVKIHPRQKERASRIVGRRWDPGKVAWVYPKTLQAYEDLKQEFEKDASVFDIRKPKRTPLPPPEVRAGDEDDWLDEDEWRDLTEKTSDIHSEFQKVSKNMEAIQDSIQILTKTTAQLESKISGNENLSESQEWEINIESVSGRALIEEALKSLAIEMAENDQSFISYISELSPLTDPNTFVSKTHERLKNELKAQFGNLLQPGDPANFFPLAKIADAEQAYPVRICKTLFTMNQSRNYLAHPPEDLSVHEVKARAISYLFCLAFVWKYVGAQPE
ncbi:hypothetical protein [Alcanivorax sp. 1008]|uniref:hypothetical protein n=1 Tax=Alcanivorax sp. 1008 TaxID=2816853 RepID=UPI001D2E7C02|nr:hypothetical protein [Alcanivorax sp. 1008]MCC1497996.1 hypothetical protein [Alcanivorax sp. 1008]